MSLTTRQQLIATQLDTVTPEQFKNYTRQQAGLDPELLDALLQASTEAPFGRISGKTLDMIARITGERPDYLAKVADLVNAVPPHERDGMIASLAVGPHDAKYVSRLAKNYANISASDLIAQKRAAAANADKTRPQTTEKPRQDVLDYRKQNESRRAAVEAAAGVNRDPTNLVRAATDPRFGHALANIIDHSHHTLANADLVDRRASVEAAWDASMASNMASDLLGVGPDLPDAPDND